MSQQIEKATPKHYLEIAKIHSLVLKSGLLAKLGNSYLKAYYKILLKDQNSMALIVKKNDKIIAFATLTTNSSGLKKTIIKKLFVKTLLALVNKPTLVWSLLSINFYPSFKKSNNIPELLSIAVHPKFQRKGLGLKLIKEISSEIKNLGHKSFRLSVRKNNEYANAFYSKIGLKKEKEVKLLKEVFVFYKCDVENFISSQKTSPSRLTRPKKRR